MHLIDSVLSLHHFAFKPQNKFEKHVVVAENNLGIKVKDKGVQSLQMVTEA